ncbi:MAG: cobalt ECF transporter T component CbiQ [Gemmatimonadales bacterium]|nr:cobalt ECF transporter T component CbiQ [Gemmatimonadales bacterium]
MSFQHLDQYATVASPLTRTVPTARVLAMVVVAVGTATLPLGAWLHLAGLAALVVGLAVAARLPARTVVTRLAGPFAFVLLASAALLFLVPGEPLWHLGPVGISQAGLERFGFVLGRASVALTAAVILVSTTRFPELLHALRQLRLPAVVITALGLGYRLLYLLVDEIERLQRAARSRNAGGGTASRRRLLVGIGAAAMARAFSRGERTHRAMLARGFVGDLPSLTPRHWDLRSGLLLAALSGTVVAVAVAAHLEF